MKSHGLGYTIDSLSRNADNVFVRATVNDLVAAIMDKIIEANDNSGSKIVYELPCTFSMIPNLTRADAQLIVLSDVITIFKTPVAEGGKGFTNTRLICGPGAPKLEITWVNGMSEEERERRKQVLNSARVPPVDDPPKKRRYESMVAVRQRASTPGLRADAPEFVPGRTIY
jgi:hypothetical protein